MKDKLEGGVAGAASGSMGGAAGDLISRLTDCRGTAVPRRGLGKEAWHSVYVSESHLTPVGREWGRGEGHVAKNNVFGRGRLCCL